MELLTTSRYFTLFTKLENINNGAVCIKAHLPLILKLDFTRAKKEHKKPNKECLSKAEQYGVGKMQDWQEEILEREGFYKLKTEQMTNSQSYEYGEILGALISIQNFSKMDNREDYAKIESMIISDAIEQMQTLFDSLTKVENTQAQEINTNLKNIIK